MEFHFRVEATISQSQAQLNKEDGIHFRVEATLSRYVPFNKILFIQTHCISFNLCRWLDAQNLDQTGYIVEKLPKLLNDDLICHLIVRGCCLGLS